MEDAHAGHGAERDQSLATSLMIAGALAFPSTAGSSAAGWAMPCSTHTTTDAAQWPRPCMIVPP